MPFVLASGRPSAASPDHAPAILDKDLLAREARWAQKSAISASVSTDSQKAPTKIYGGGIGQIHNGHSGTNV